MKKLEIKTEKATLLVVDLPTCKTHLFYKGYYVMDSSDKGLNDKCRKISQGDTQEFYYIGPDCKYLGKVSEITEEEWKGIVDNSIHTGLYAHYVKGVNPANIFNYKSSIESGLSLLKANGVVFEMPSCDSWCCEDGVVDIVYGESVYCDNCLENKEKVWSNPNVFIKVD